MCLGVYSTVCLDVCMSDICLLYLTVIVNLVCVCVRRVVLFSINENLIELIDCKYKFCNCASIGPMLNCFKLLRYMYAFAFKNCCSVRKF